jgi:hypothetical protein
MKKNVLGLFILISACTVSAQGWITDSVIIGPGYANRGFYSLENGNVGSVPFSTRDWLIDVSAVYTASIRINGGFSAQLYKYTAGDTSDWASLDTAGLGTGNGWARARDDRESYTPSAFEFGETGHPNYGWGEYNQATNIVTGNSLFVYKTVGNGSPNSAQWKKIWIKDLTAFPREFHILAANLDGTGAQNITISKDGIGDKSFIYYSFASDQVFNDEPVASSYDLVFTKFEDEYVFSGGTSIQAVTGVEVQKGVEVAKASGVIEDDAVYTNYTLQEDIYGIGHDWKFLNSSFQFEVADSLSYFVQDIPGNIWQIRFTGFVGTSQGKFIFQKRKVAFASLEPVETIGAWNVFPNPASDLVQVVFSSVAQEEAVFSLMDLNGRTVFSQTMTAQQGINQIQLDTEILPASGVYIAVIQIGTERKMKKLIVR